MCERITKTLDGKLFQSCPLIRDSDQIRCCFSSSSSNQENFPSNICSYLSSLMIICWRYPLTWSALYRRWHTLWTCSIFMFENTSNISIINAECCIRSFNSIDGNNQYVLISIEFMKWIFDQFACWISDINFHFSTNSLFELVRCVCFHQFCFQTRKNEQKVYRSSKYHNCKINRESHFGVLHRDIPTKNKLKVRLATFRSLGSLKWTWHDAFSIIHYKLWILCPENYLHAIISHCQGSLFNFRGIASWK
jgi:hypothetical protein